MVTVITRTIGPSGRDYASFTLAEADVTNIGTSADLVANDEAIVFEADAGDYSENVTFSTGGALTCDATRNVTWTHATGAGHGGVFGAGANIVGAFTVQESYTVVDGLSISPVSNDAFIVSNAPVGIIAQNLCIETVTGEAVYMARAGTASEPAIVRNCNIYAPGSRRGFDLQSNGVGDAHYLIVNNTVNSGSQAFLIGLNSSDTLYVELYNNLAIGGRAWFQRTGYTLVLSGSNNFGPSTNPFPSSIAGSPDPITPLADTYDPGVAGDYALYESATGKLIDSPHNDVVGQGVGPSANSDVPTTDILGDPRSGATANPGAFEDLVVISPVLTPTGIASGEAFGSPTLTPGAVTVTATGIASVEAFGTATVQTGAVTVTATAIGSGEAFGTPSVSQGAGSAQSLSATGIASGEAFGSPEVQPGTATIAPPGIGSGVVFGVPNLLGQVGILPVQIFSAEAFGTPTLSGGAPQLLPSGIPTAEAFGSPTLSQGAAQLLPSGIPTAEAFGTPTLSGGTLQPPTVTTNQIVAPNGRLEADTISHTDQYTYVKLEKSGALTGGETISYHWYFKVDSGLAAGTGETITFSIKDSGGTVVEEINWTVAYDDATPTVALGSTTTAGSGYTTAALEYVAISNDWVRCSITLTDFGSTGQDVAVTHTGEPGATSAGTAYDVTLWGSEVTTLDRTPTANELRPVSGGIVDFDAYPAEHRSLFGSYTDLGDNQYRVGITLTDDTSSADYARIEHYQANSAETTHQIYLSSPSVDDIDLDLLADVLINPPKPGGPFFDIPLITHAVHELGNDGRVPTTVATFGYYAGHLGWWDTEGAVVEKEPQPYGGDKITVIVPPVRGNGSTP